MTPHHQPDQHSHHAQGGPNGEAVAEVVLDACFCGTELAGLERFLADGSKERFCKQCGNGIGEIAPARAAHATK